MRAFVTGVSIVLLLALSVDPIRAEDGDLQMLIKSTANSNARAINLAGSAVGFKMVQSTDLTAMEEKAFYAAKGKVKTIPQLPKYTATFPTAISDNELVVGYCSKPVGDLNNLPKLNLQAFVWDPSSNAMTPLPVLQDYERCMAFGISADGRRISGVCGGKGAMSACVWEKGAAGWEGKALPGSAKTPLLVTSGACISRDGNFISGMDENNPARWARQPDGSWVGKVLKDDESFITKGINDSGSMVGYRRTPDVSGNFRGIVWSDKDGLTELGVLPNTRSSQALGINNAGVVVGVSEQPGNSGGPQAFVYQGGKFSRLVMPKVVVSYAYAINEKGQIAGYCGREEDESVSAFVWTPKTK